MTWPKYVLLAWFLWAAVATVGNVGKPRGPVTPRLAAGVVFLSVIWAALVVLA